MNSAVFFFFTVVDLHLIELNLARDTAGDKTSETLVIQSILGQFQILNAPSRLRIVNQTIISKSEMRGLSQLLRLRSGISLSTVMSYEFPMIENMRPCLV